MKNILSFRIESWVGSFFVLIFSVFLAGTFILAVKNFNRDADIMVSSSSRVRLKTVSVGEKILIDNWLAKANTDPSAQKVSYRFLIKKYPDKPWLEK